MRRILFTLVVTLGVYAPSRTPSAMQVRPLSSAEIVGRQLIVGRAHCAGATWLLTDGPELTRVSVDTHAVSSSPVRGLRQGEKPWGLACLTNGELWTLVTHEALARITPGGHVVERIRLDRPRLGIYSAGDHLLLQQAPAGQGKPLLSSGVPRNVPAFVQWPAPVSQGTRSGDDQLRANLVNCGIGVSGYVPCWLAHQSRLVIGNGTPAHTVVQELRFVHSGTTDQAAPIWDVALAGSSRVWVLASARAVPDGRRLGGRLTRSTRQGVDEGFIDLNASARLILWAADDRCVLLSVTGQLLEVLAS
jgi:hypothetical protein